MAHQGGIGTFHGGGMSVGGGTFLGGVDFGLCFVDGQWGVWVASSGGVKPKVSLLLKPLELQYYFVQFFAAK